MSEYIVDMGTSSYQSSSGLLCADVSQLREEIVRCRDCVKWDYDSTYPKKTCFEFSNPEDGYLVATSPDGYCAWGER